MIDNNHELKVDVKKGPFGVMPGDIPLIGDVDGDGITDIAIFRHGTWYIDYCGDGAINAVGTYGILTGDIPLTFSSK